MSYDLEQANIINDILILSTEEGIICIPEENCTIEEAEMFRLWREKYPSGKEIEQQLPAIVEEQIDEEKVMLTEAVLYLSNQLQLLKEELNTLKGGN